MFTFSKLNRLWKGIALIFLLITAMSFAMADNKITIYLIGDSTISKKDVKAYPEAGWGMPFVYFFDSSVTIDNRAMNGRSTGSFIRENRWQTVVDQLKAGDYVFIQFGHNDESKDKGDRYTAPEDYKNNLRKFISETKKSNAIPVLLTPVSRRKFDKDGHAVATHEAYSLLVKEVAKETGVLFIDLDEESKRLYDQLGEGPSKLLFNQLEPGEHPNYPAGVKDNTHFNELGARKIAQIILRDITTMVPDLANRVVKREVKKK